MTEVLERAGAREADSAAERSRYAEEALDRAARAATSQWVTAAAFRGCTLAVDTDVQSYRRALHIVEHRDVVVRTAPGRGTRPGHLDALPDPSLIDPWGTGNENLEVATRVVVECTACAGAKHVACPACGGRARIRCDECEGKGEIRTTRNTNSVRVGQHLSARSSVSHGMKNCPRCHGDGQKKCPNCRNGFIDCGTCENTGRVTAWLEVTRSVSSQVVAHPGVDPLSWTG